jgi:hypothetical protein
VKTQKALIFSVLFPLLAAEIVISLAFWRLFAPVESQSITRLLHGLLGQGLTTAEQHYAFDTNTSHRLRFREK